jgi:hypothetical protein
MTDWTPIIEAILGVIALVSAGIGVRCWTLYVDSKKLVEILKGLIIVIQEMIAEIKEANSDGKITQEEFDKLMVKANALSLKCTEAMSQGKIVIDDILALKKEIMDFINEYQAKNGKK